VFIHHLCGKIDSGVAGQGLRAHGEIKLYGPYGSTVRDARWPQMIVGKYQKVIVAIPEDDVLSLPSTINLRLRVHPFSSIRLALTPSEKK
jgi:hypothetical protein